MKEKMVDGITADHERAQWLLEQNVIIITALVPVIGYDKSAEVAKVAFAEGRGVREVALEMGVLPEDELHAALDLRPMTEGGVVG
jgi:fumarate hydratase class II